MFLFTFQWSHAIDQPWIVHCSAGIGRTGAFLAIDLGMQMLDKYLYADVNKIIARLRLDRGGMVQHREQAAFVYHTLLEYCHHKVDRKRRKEE